MDHKRTQGRERTKTARCPLRCDSCDSPLVHPTAYAQIATELWMVDLRCPDCGRCSEAVLGERQLEQLDRELDHAVAEIEQELRRVEADNMRHWATCFARAIELELLGADDFARAC